MRRVLSIRTENNVSPVLDALSNKLTAPGVFPPLPGKMITVETSLCHSGLYVRLMPSPELLKWLADVQQAGLSG